MAIFQYQKVKVQKWLGGCGCNDSQLNFQAALGVAQEAIEKEKGGIKALQEQLQSGKVGVEPILVFLFLGACQKLDVGARESGSDES